MQGLVLAFQSLTALESVVVTSFAAPQPTNQAEGSKRKYFVSGHLIDHTFEDRC